MYYSLEAPDDERKYRSKPVQQPRNNKLSYTLHLAGHFRIRVLYHDARKHEYLVQNAKFTLIHSLRFHNFQALPPRIFPVCRSKGKDSPQSTEFLVPNNINLLISTM